MESETTDETLEFAQFRNWYCKNWTRLSEYPALAEAWERTRQTLAVVRDRLQRAELPSEIETIYVCGSMGRMEQLPASDCDLVIVVENSITPRGERGRELFCSVWDELSDLEFERPKSEGIFSQVVSWDQLVSRSSLGVVDEDQSVYGTRIQLLLDSQPVYQFTRFQNLAAEVLSRADCVDRTGNSNWIPLVCELMRYWRSLCTRTFWISSSQPGTRRTITTKLNHSRLLLIAGLLCLLGEASSRTNRSHRFLLQRLCLTPLERIAYCTTGSTAFLEIVFRYNTFLSRMSDREFVTRLQDPELPSLHTPEFAELEENARELKSSLMSSIVDRSLMWPTEFRESLIL